MDIEDVLILLDERENLHEEMKRKHDFNSIGDAFHDGASTALSSISTMIRVRLTKEETL